MKILSYFVLFLTLIIGGCEDKTNLPTNPPGSNETKWIQIPANQNISVEANFSSSKIINGEAGGEIVFESSYNGGPHGTVHVYSKIVFPPNSFTGDKTIKMSINDDYTILTFTPAMVFNTPAILNVTFDGLDLSTVDPAVVDFVYENDFGVIEEISRRNVQVITSSGTLKLEDAVIPHFSRLGFTR